MHVAAAAPKYLDRKSVPADLVAKEKEIAVDQARQSGKPDAVLAKIADGKVEKYYQENCLLEQSFIKNPEMTVESYLKDTIAKLGENMGISRFVRFELGRGETV